jgi:hypothetical protein
MDRRDALRAATAIALGTAVAGCDAGPRIDPPRTRVSAEPARPILAGLKQRGLVSVTMSELMA